MLRRNTHLDIKTHSKKSLRFILTYYRNLVNLYYFFLFKDLFKKIYFNDSHGKTYANENADTQVNVTMSHVLKLMWANTKCEYFSHADFDAHTYTLTLRHTHFKAKTQCDFNAHTNDYTQTGVNSHTHFDANTRYDDEAFFWETLFWC